MSDYKDQKELKMAMNGRMGLMTGGIILLVTAVSSTLMYGINLFSIASGAAKGEQEYTDILTQANMDISTVRFIAVCFLVLACWEIYSGIFCTMRCNRLDKAKGTKIISIVTLVAEILMQAVLFFTHMMNLGTLLLAIVVPAYMIWGATRLEKLAKLYPDRKIALNTEKGKGRTQRIEIIRGICRYCTACTKEKPAGACNDECRAAGDGRRSRKG